MDQSNITDQFRIKAGVSLMKKKNLKIDMTPMVDLGFLLIAFFIFSTELSRPAVTKLYMPHDGDSTKVPDSKSLTILLSDNHNIYYYYGNMKNAIEENQIFATSFYEITGLGKVIRQKQKELEKRKFDKKELLVLIKPGKHSSYRDVVNALDEMLINDVTKYVITDQQPREEKALESLK